LAALAATSAFAQSTVSITGLADLGYQSVNGPAKLADYKGVAKDGSATTVLTFAGTEDLGGGTSAVFKLQLTPDFNTGGGVAQANTSAGSVPAPTGQEAFVGLADQKLGTLKLGRNNSNVLAAWGVGSVFGTAIGSGYSSNGNVFTRYSTTGVSAYNTAPTRFNNSVKYESPSFNGFTASVLHAAKIDDNTTATANRQGVTDIGLQYTNGPLNVAYGTQKITQNGTVDVTVQNLGAGTLILADGKSNKLSILSANYTFGAAKLFAATWTEKQDTTTPVDTSGRMIGASYTIGATTLMASMGASNDKTTADVDKKIRGIGADYALSKRTALYARIDSRDANKNSSTDDATNGTTKRTAIGLRHTF
jgi:predicted porin